MASVYFETTIVGHIAGRVHPDPFVAARQQITRDWWQNEAPGYEVFISQVVLDECCHGDPSAAAERLEVVKDLDLLEASNEVDDLADALVSQKAVPASEPRDAFHIAIAAVHGVDYLLTWNCKHIANATLRGRIEKVCRDAGYEPPSFARQRNSWRSMMIHNPINEEIREIRHRLAAQFENDVYRIGAQLRLGQAASAHRVVRRPRRQPVASHTTKQAMPPTEMGGRDSA